MCIMKIIQKTFKSRWSMAMIVVAVFCLAARQGYSGADVDAEYSSRLAAEMALLEKMESRLDSVTESLSEHPAGNDGLEVFSDAAGLRVTRRLYEFGVYLYSVEASDVSLEDVMLQLGEAGAVDVAFEMVEPAIRQNKVDISLENLPLQDILEVVTGMHGLEFQLSEDRHLTVTTPLNTGFKTPREYYKNKAVQAFRKVQIKYPDGKQIPESHFKLGDFFYSMDMVFIASQEYMVVAERFPKHPLAKEALRNVARCFNEIGDFKRARDIYNQFIERYPHDESLDNVYWAITDTWYKEGKYDVAIVLFEKILGMYPDTALKSKINEGIAVSYVRTGKYAKALDLLIASKRGTDKAEWGVEKDFMVAECLYQMDRPDDAFVVFASLVGNPSLDNERSVKTLLRQAQCLDKMNHCLEAIESYKRWVQASGEDVQGMLFVGRCLRRLDLSAKAIGILEDAYKINRKKGLEYGEDIAFELAMSYYEARQFAKAVKLFTDISRNSDSDLFVDSKFFGAESVFGNKEYEAAISLYEDLVVFLADDAERMQHVEDRIASCYQSLGRNYEVLDAYKK